MFRRRNARDILLKSEAPIAAAVRALREIRLVSTIICFCIGTVAPIAMVGWVLLR
jgi:hypothetical protein